jgi:phosphoribosyl 1,2-cyclic phosphate phosphodiesterase
MTYVVTILGCGSSGGVPRVADGWGACDPTNPKNRRRRCSILVEKVGQNGRTTVLVDASPDLREQLIDENVRHLDGVLITHEHADHVHGIDDLRPLAIHMRRRIDVWMDNKTSRSLNERFGYCFQSPDGSDYPPILSEHRMTAGEYVSVEGAGGSVTALPFEMEHGRGSALGLRFGPVAYLSDVSRLPEKRYGDLADLDVLIIDALRRRPHPTHFNLDDALKLIAELEPARAVLTNMHNDLDYGALTAELPSHIEPAYDGLKLELNSA